MGIAALSVDASFMFDMRQKLAAAADSAAKSGAFEVKRGNSVNVLAFATSDVADHIAAGLLPAGVSVDAARLCNDAGATCTAPYNTAKYVEVILSSNQPTFFGRILGYASLTPVARAVAGSSSPSACFITMHDLYMKNATIDLDNCGAQVGGNLTYDNNPSDIVGPVSVTGTCGGGGGHCSDADLANLQPAPENPFKDLLPPATVPATCPDSPPAVIVDGGCYHNIANTVTTLPAGIITITGSLDVSDLTATSGTLLYFTSTGKLTAGMNSTLRLTASNSIAGYAGIAMYGDPGSKWDLDTTNHFNVYITGAVAMAGSDVDIKNHLQMFDTGCTLLVFNTWTEKAGNGALGTRNCDTLFSNASFLGVSLAE